MKLTDNEKRQLKGGFGGIEFSVNIGTHTYPEHKTLQKKLKEVNVRSNDTTGGTSIWPQNLWQLRRAKKVCKDLGIKLNKGATYRGSYQYEKDVVRLGLIPEK